MRVVLAALLSLLSVSCGEKREAGDAGFSENQINVIAPYFKNGTWVFDDEKKGLVEEPFVSGVPEIINTMVADLPKAKEGFRLTFSADPFPEYELKALRQEPEGGGYWYSIEGTAQRGWLCPALLRYYEEAPEVIYAKADALSVD